LGSIGFTIGRHYNYFISELQIFFVLYFLNFGLFEKKLCKIQTRVDKREMGRGGGAEIRLPGAAENTDPVLSAIYNLQIVFLSAAIS
jgi:hypothetical protein